MVDSALSKNEISGVMLLCYENERPLQGMIAYLDWRLDGHFSHLLKTQVMTGAEGESLYAPLLWNERTLHFLVIGGGSRDERTPRTEASKTLLKSALQKLDQLKLENMAISKQDWNVGEDSPEIRERKLCILN
jgi:hypothetical protein